MVLSLREEECLRRIPNLMIIIIFNLDKKILHFFGIVISVGGFACTRTFFSFAPAGVVESF